MLNPTFILKVQTISLSLEKFQCIAGPADPAEGGGMAWEHLPIQILADLLTLFQPVGPTTHHITTPTNPLKFSDLATAL